jgi:hypothetical protein
MGKVANRQAVRRPRSGGDSAQRWPLAGLAWCTHGVLWPDGVGLQPVLSHGLVLIKGGQHCSCGSGPCNNFN